MQRIKGCIRYRVWVNQGLNLPTRVAIRQFDSSQDKMHTLRVKLIDLSRLNRAIHSNLVLSLELATP